MTYYIRNWQNRIVLDGWLGVYQISIQQIFGAEAAPCFDDDLGVERGNGGLCTVLYCMMTLGFRGAVMNYSGIDPFWQIRGPPLLKLKHYRAHRGLIWIKKFKKIIWGLCTYGYRNYGLDKNYNILETKMSPTKIVLLLLKCFSGN